MMERLTGIEPALSCLRGRVPSPFRRQPHRRNIVIYECEFCENLDDKKVWIMRSTTTNEEIFVCENCLAGEDWTHISNKQN